MKSIVGAVVLLVAVAAASAEAPISDNTVFDYHRRFGIPEAARIKQAEEEALSAGAERIVGGTFVDISLVPYQAGLIISLSDFQSICGGSLIAADRIVTAAHCHFDGSIAANSYTVVLGSSLLFFGGVRVNTSDITVHPEWNPSTVANDIAVLRIPSVTFSPFIQPIALPSESQVGSLFTGVIGTASGYGVTRAGSGINTSQRLSWVNLRVIPNFMCEDVFGPVVQETNLCTNGVGGRGMCPGDSGGPLVISSGGRSVLIGVTSFSAAAGCNAGFPSAFTRVTSYLPFIQFS